MKPRLMHFLLVEDDDSHARMTMRSLQSNRVANTIDRVSDGAAAIDYLYQRGEYAHKARPCVILLDLNLPKLDGHEVLAKIKSDPNLRSIPVVILTTSSAETDRAKAYTEFANSYIVKPVDFAKFKEMVSELALYWGIWNLQPDNAGETRSNTPRVVNENQDDAGKQDLT